MTLKTNEKKGRQSRKGEKMKVIIKDNDKIIFESENIKDILNNFMYLMYAKVINQVKVLTFKCNYNYTDIQTIRVIDRRESLNKREYIFEGIPTSWGALDTYTMLKDIK